MKAKKIKRFLTVVFLWPVYYLSYLVPRSKKIWVFGSFSNTFADNSKYLFLQQHIVKASTGITSVWITKSEDLAVEMRKNGYKSYQKKSLQGIWYCLRASVYVYSWTVRDTNFWLSGGARYVSLWHGIPFKKIGSDSDAKRSMVYGKPKKFSPGALLKSFLHPSLNLQSDVLLSTHSDEITRIFRQTFITKRIAHALYPRVEHFVMEEAARENFVNVIATAEEKRLLKLLKQFDSVWVYMPTFRDYKEDKEKMYAREVFDFRLMNSVLKGKNILLLVKYHYVAMQKLAHMEELSNVLFINSKMDMYVILPHTSGLITDYSSVFFDYMLLQKPMVFYNFDIDTYLSNSREFYYPYDEVTCGPKINTFKGLCTWFEKGHYKNASFDYSPYIKRFWGHSEKPYLLEQLHQLFDRN